MRKRSLLNRPKYIGAFRLWISLSCLWILLSTSQYLAGLERHYSVYSTDLTVLDMPAERIKTLPTLDEFKTLAERALARGDYLSDFEARWISLTPARMPRLYDRPRNEDSCEKVAVQNKGGAAIQYTTLCRQRWSTLGFTSLLAGPVLLLAIFMSSSLWVLQGFRRNTQ